MIRVVLVPLTLALSPKGRGEQLPLPQGEGWGEGESMRYYSKLFPNALEKIIRLAFL